MSKRITLTKSDISVLDIVISYFKSNLATPPARNSIARLRLGELEIKLGILK